MKTIISASRRTDIPSFYLKWFIEAIKKRKLTVQNPFYKNKSHEVDLSPSTVQWIVFWSRNYSVFLKHRTVFDDYMLFFHFTINSHNNILEKKSIPIKKALQQTDKIAHIYGPERIIWRYDPIVIWMNGNTSETNFKKNDFSHLCSNMNKMGVAGCYFSFVSPYTKFLRRFNKMYPKLKIKNNQLELKNKILNEMLEIAYKNNISLFSCCNDSLIQEGVKKGRCISGKYLNQLCGEKIVSEAKSPTRKDCGCTRSIDIGDYVSQPCYFGCIYCYANPVWE